jgi:hypothetical protein
MEQVIPPIAKSLYICDDVVRDPGSGKIILVNLWDTIRTPLESAFPYSLKKLCAFAWLRDGQGHVRSRIDLVQAATGSVIRQTPEYVIEFEHKRSTVFASYKLEDCVFPEPGYYFIELYCENQFMDDQAIRVVSG